MVIKHEIVLLWSQQRKEKLEDVFVGSENEINKHNKIHKYLRKVDSMKPDRFASPLISGNIFAIEPQHR